MGAGGACTSVHHMYTTHYRVYTEKKSAYTTRISVCHGYSTSTKQHSYVSSISAVLRLPLDIYPFRIVVLSLCVLGFLHVNFLLYDDLLCFHFSMLISRVCTHWQVSMRDNFEFHVGKLGGNTHHEHVITSKKSAFCEEATLGVTFNPGRFIDTLSL